MFYMNRFNKTPPGFILKCIFMYIFSVCKPMQASLNNCFIMLIMLDSEGRIAIYA